MRARDREDHRVVDAVPGKGGLATVYVADEVRVWIAPLEHGVVGTDYRFTQVGVLVREEGVLRVVVAIEGQPHLEGRGLTVQRPELPIDWHAYRD